MATTGPEIAIDLQARTAQAAGNESRYLGFNPQGIYAPFDVFSRKSGTPIQTPFAHYGLGNDPYELLAEQYHSTQLLDPQANPYASQAAVRAMEMASGKTGNQLGEGTQAAIGNQAAAGAAIGTAGAANAAAQNTQFGQTGNDLNVVRASALGTGPSAAENLARSQLDSNIRAQASLAGTARGGNIASAMRGAQSAGSSMMLQSQAQMAAQRAQEQLNAQQLLTSGNNALNQSLGSARNTDIGQAVAGASAADRVTANEQALAGFKGNTMSVGQQALGTSADRRDAEVARFLQARGQAAGAATNYGLQKYSLDLGLPMASVGPQTNLQIAQMEDSRAREAAVWNAVGTGIAGLGQFGR